jgi:hypothetical protein
MLVPCVLDDICGFAVIFSEKLRGEVSKFGDEYLLINLYVYTVAAHRGIRSNKQETFTAKSANNAKQRSILIRY